MIESPISGKDSKSYQVMERSDQYQLDTNETLRKTNQGDSMSPFLDSLIMRLESLQEA
jgi:hypothetical protein